MSHCIKMGETTGWRHHCLAYRSMQGQSGSARGRRPVGGTTISPTGQINLDLRHCLKVQGETAQIRKDNSCLHGAGQGDYSQLPTMMHRKRLPINCCQEG